MREKGTIIEQFPRTIFTEYYIIRLTKYDKIPENPLDGWMTYLKTGIVSEDTRTPGLAEVKKKLDYLKMTESERRPYDIYLDNIVQEKDAIKTARNEGIAIGEEKGRDEKAVEVARNMLRDGLDPSLVSLCTGLPISEFDTLLSSGKE